MSAFDPKRTLGLISFETGCGLFSLAARSRSARLLIDELISFKPDVLLGITQVAALMSWVQP
jgi:hypothetical protein